MGDADRLDFTVQTTATIEVLEVRNAPALLGKEADAAMASSDQMSVGECLVELIEEPLFQLACAMITKVRDGLYLENFPRFGVEHAKRVVVRPVCLLLRLSRQDSQKRSKK